MHKGLAGVVVDTTAISEVVPETNSLTYRGHPVQELAARCSIEAVAHLLWHGELPDAAQLAAVERAERAQRAMPPALVAVLEQLPTTCHPMDTLRTAVSVLGAHDRLTGLGATAVELVAGDFTYDGGRAAVAGMASLPDAIVCANDMMAIGCIDELRLVRGKAVPRDISVVGFDGSSPGCWANYNLTTVRQPTRVMVEAALDMLVARIEQPEMHTEKRMFSGELVTGGSARIG